MRHPLRILSVEDDRKDHQLIQDLLETEGIVCDITRGENGRLWSSPNSPRGSNFHFTLPTAAETHE
jgi:hypothetical protein